MVGSAGLSRFASELPAVDEFVSLGEGDTPLLPLREFGHRLNIRKVSAKMESQNPTGSYKDRVAAMSLSLACQRGNAGWIATSSGNAGLAMAAYGRRAGLPGFLCLVASAPEEKRLPLVPYNIGIVAVDGVGQESTAAAESRLMELVRAASVRHDLYLGITAHAFNPAGMRGIDTISYELAEQAPDVTHLYVPTGGGGLLTAIARGLDHCSVAARVIACQPSGCAPIARFLSRHISEPEIERCDSIISALQLPRPPDGRVAAEAVTRLNGWGTAVSDEAILAAQRLLAETEGILVEPASAVGLAALMVDIDEGRLGIDDHPVLILSGAGWKDLSPFVADVKRLPNACPGEIAQRIDEWATALDQRVRRGR